MFFEGGFSFANFLADVVTVFVFVVWFWLLITVAGDLLRRDDTTGWHKALWVIILIGFPYIGVFAYLVSQGRGIAERNLRRTQEASDGLRRALGFSVADEIEKLQRLKTAGSINEGEFARLRAKLVQ